MQIIVIGCGKVGSKLAQVLSEEGHGVVVVDNENKAFKSLDSSFNGITVTGVPIDQDVLRQAGIETADAIAAVTPDDNVNIMVCQIAKEIFKVPCVLARIYNPARENHTCPHPNTCYKVCYLKTNHRYNYYMPNEYNYH